MGTRHAVYRSFEPKTSHDQEPEAETIAQLVAATLARLSGKSDNSFSWTHLAAQDHLASPQQVGRMCVRVLERVKRVLDHTY
jgi:galactose-1-phosphate uridylyltransferase